MRNKRAFEVQFNWMFVLIVGASILMFFAAIAIKQKDISKASIDITILKSIQSIVSSASISTGTTQIKDIPSSSIGIDCNEISVGGSSKQYESLILFAPSLIKGEKIITKASVFSAPYKVANFLYMTSPQVRYVIISNGKEDTLARQVNRSLPSELDKEFYDNVPILKNNNNYKVRFVFFRDVDDSVLAPFKDMFEYDVTALKISGGSENSALEFYEKKDNIWESKGTSVYIGLNSLVGAVYADKLEVYECNIQNSFETLSLITDVYIARTTSLSDNSRKYGQIECSRVYEDAKGYLDTIKSSSSNFDQSSVKTINDAAASLSNKNQEAQYNSCSLVY